MSTLALESLIILAAKYGPQFVLDILAIFKAQDVTVAAVEAAFQNLKPYEAYRIPQVVTGGQPAPAKG